MRARPAALYLTLPLLLAACDAGSPSIALEISGDSVVHAATYELPDGQQNVLCRYGFGAAVAGGAGDTAVIRKSRVTFSFLDTGLEHITLEWPSAQLPALWPDSVLAGGDSIASSYQDIGFSLPFRPVRGSAVFDYTVGADDAVQTTEPFVFTCR